MLVEDSLLDFVVCVVRATSLSPSAVSRSYSHAYRPDNAHQPMAKLKQRIPEPQNVAWKLARPASKNHFTNQNDAAETKARFKKQLHKEAESEREVEKLHSGQVRSGEIRFHELHRFVPGTHEKQVC